MGVINMKKKFMVLVLACAVIGCGIWRFCPNPTIFFELSEYNLADSKLFGNVVVSSNSGHLIFFDKKGNVIKEYEAIYANWIYAIAEEGIIVVANSKYELRKIIVDAKYNVISNDILFTSDNLMIDPTIMRMKNGQWILSYVEIQGTVNNADVNSENGIYTVHVFKSSDLIEWEKMTDIVSEKKNIEDGDMFECNGKIYYLYEKEILDKMPSEICMRYSEDGCTSWSNERVVIPANGDNEMAGIVVDGDKIILYYSSDLEKPGLSYNGASAYKAIYDLDFLNEEINIPVDIPENQGILLYDIYLADNKLYFLYARNYLTENTLVFGEREYD